MANTFTGLQTINGDLKADHVLVKITAPTLNTHLTSKLYVDTAISNVNVNTTNLSKLDQANTLTATNSFTDITTTSLINKEHSEQARAPHTSGPRDVPRCGALSLLQKDAALQGGSS